MKTYSEELIDNIESACIDYIPKDIYENYLIKQFNELRQEHKRLIEIEDFVYLTKNLEVKDEDVKTLKSRMTEEYKEWIRNREAKND